MPTSHPFRTLTSLAVVALPLVGGAACATEPRAVEADAPYVATIDPAARRLGACVDPSGSVDRAVVAAGLDEIASVFRALPTPSPEAARQAARAPVPGIHLVLRQISSNSMSSATDELLDVDVPGVPGLVEPPSAAEFETFAERNAAWEAARAEVDDLAARAAAARSMALDALSTVELVEGGSEIAGCLTGLRDSFPVGSDFVAVIVSDLEQTGPPQLHGDFSQVHVVIGHACAEAARCDQTADDWRSVFDQLGVASTSFVSVNQLDGELSALLGGF